MTAQAGQKPPGSRWRRVPLRLRGQADRSTVARRLFLALALVSCASATPRLLSAAATPQAHRIALAGAVWIAASIIVLYLRGKANPVIDLLDALALVAIAFAGADDALLSFAYPVAFFAVLYGSRLRVAWRAGTWMAAFAAGLAFLGNGTAAEIPGHVISQLVMSAVLHMLVTTLERNDQVISHQRTLAAAGARLVAAQTRDEVHAAALQAAHGLVDDPNVAACVLLPADDTVEIVAARGYEAESLPGRRFPMSLIDQSRPSSRIPASLPGFREVLIAPLVVEDQLTGVLTLGTDGTFPPATDEALGALGSQTTLALERIDASERFRSLVQHSSDVVTIVGADGLVRYQSPSFERLTGSDPAATVGRPVVTLLHPDDAGRLEHCLADPTTRSQQLQLRWRGVDGDWRDSEIVLSNLLDERSVNGWVLNTRDVSDRAALELELRHAQKLEAVGRLSAGVAHEINTPIQFVGDNVSFVATAFDSLTELVESYRKAVADQLPGSSADMVAALAQAEEDADLEFLKEEVPKALREAAEGVKRVSAIVRAMKAFGHPDAAEQAAANLDEALESTITVARNELKYVADVTCELGGLPPVRCFVGDLNQVFLNLLVNAAHAIADRLGDSGGRGRITARTWREGDDALISITDTGTGIPEHIRANIFDPFFTTKEVGRGTGQGLALVQAIVVDRHGGTVTVDSEVGVGTTFVLRLPIHGAHDAAAATGVSLDA